MNSVSFGLGKKFKFAIWIFSKEWQILQCLLFRWKGPQDTAHTRYFSNHHETMLPYITFALFLSGVMEVLLFHIFIRRHIFYGWWIIEDLSIISVMYILSIFKSIFFSAPPLREKLST